MFLSHKQDGLQKSLIKGFWVMGGIIFWTLSLSSLGFCEKYSVEKPIVPEYGKTLVFIGQDQLSIENYVRYLQKIPAGVMAYTSIQRLEGLDVPVNLGAGICHMKYLLEEYPHSYVQIGLYMVGALKKINQGEYDENIDTLAHWIKESNRGVYLRIGYEFDLKDNGYDPDQYIKAFQRIVNRFRALEVKNVAFVWHSGAYDHVPDPMRWYPGDEYVDWFGVSLFNPMQYGKIKDFYGEAILKDKPFMIAESTPAGMYTETGKLDWFKKFFFIIEELSPQAICYINADWDNQPMWKSMKWGNASLQNFLPIKKYWLKEIQKENFIHADSLQ